MSPEEKFIYASYLYYEEDLTPIWDHEYDTLAKTLLCTYDSLSENFKDRVTKEDLECGTGHMLKYSGSEIRAAINWAVELGIWNE